MNFFFFFLFSGFQIWAGQLEGKSLTPNWEVCLGKTIGTKVTVSRQTGRFFHWCENPRGCEENPEPVLVCLMRCHVVKIVCLVTRTASCDKVGKVSFASYWLPAHIVPRGVFDLQMSYYTIYILSLIHISEPTRH